MATKNTSFPKGTWLEGVYLLKEVIFKTCIPTLKMSPLFI